MAKNSILFLLKKNGLYSDKYSTTAKSGLLNSATLTAEQLHKHLGIEVNIEICIDANEIDKFVHKHKPKYCIIEALWVQPDKLHELEKLHKKVLFIIRIHSEIPFLAMEGNAIDLIKGCDYVKNVYIAFNSLRTAKDFENIIEKNIYLPNIYDDEFRKPDSKKWDNDVIDCASFGALRPLKNQLIQAFAAIKYANDNNKKLYFHINASRLEQGGESVLRNMIALFKNTQHELVQHKWVERKEFLELVKKMDIGLQVSFTESFNIVSCDFVKQGVPIIVSETIEWMPEICMANELSVTVIANKIERAIHKKRTYVLEAQKYLTRYNKFALRAWSDFFLTKI